MEGPLRPAPECFGQAGPLRRWNDEQIGAGEDWYQKITEAMDAASVGVFLISADFLGSNFILKEEVKRLIERRKDEGLSIVPVYVRACDWPAVDWLAAMQIRPAGDRPVDCGQGHLVDQEFSKIAKEIRLLLKKAEADGPAARPAQGLIKPPDLVRLPRAGEHLFGRERELALLDGAWADERTSVISLIAWGGVGKSALVRRWLGNMARDQYRGARLVYGWSFYKQSLREEEASADEFFEDALRWFGEPKPEAFQQIERARRLAERIQKERTLLVLDGLEPLQHPATTSPEGQIKDQTLAELVRLLVWQNPGLLVITSRYVVDDIRDQRTTTAPVIELGHLSPEAGGQLLRALGVEGEEGELEAASREYGGHSLALNLLGAYLKDILGGDVRRRSEVSLLEEDAERGGHARRIMRSYEQQFAGSPELQVLHLIGLFDRPARRELIDLLRRPPVIEGLNDELINLGEPQWKRALARLTRVQLLLEETPEELDAHPLVREHFGTRVREERAAAWRAGHGRLYEHLKGSAKELPDTLAEMAPLFQAMHHGCQADRHQEAAQEVYYARIQRSGEFYSSAKLGAFGADLAAIAGLFAEPWDQPVATLEPARAFLLNAAGHRLRALGRLREAVAPMRASLDGAGAQEDWKNAAIGASNLAALHLTLGDVREAVAMGETSVEHADRSEDPFWQMASHANWAGALHQAGDVARARALFEKAEMLQVECEPNYPRLYSLQGFLYCDLLLTLDRAGEVHERAQQTLAWIMPHQVLLSIALNHLSLGRAAKALGKQAEARAQLDQAVDGLRKAGQIQEVPGGLLARAGLFRETGEFEQARRDLDEAMRLAKRSEMRLFQCDAHLETCRLMLAEKKEKATAQEHLDEAARLVEECGYGRRRPEVEALRERLG